jgi:excisionase family DNA binding protein
MKTTHPSVSTTPLQHSGRPNLRTGREKRFQEYLTTGVTARYCGVSKVTVLRWIEKGELKAFKLPGGQNRIHQDDFYAFATKHNIPIRNMYRE